MEKQGLCHHGSPLHGKASMPDSSPMEKFPTGAVRGSDLKKQRYDLIPGKGATVVMTCELPWPDDYENLTPADRRVYRGEATRIVYDWIMGRGRLESAIAQLVVLMGGRSEAMRRLAETSAYGAEKYNEWNWLKGFPVSSLLNHALKHLAVYDADGESLTASALPEDDLAHALWNLCVALEFQDRKDLMDIGPRKPEESV